jgi:hypothetical protein
MDKQAIQAKRKPPTIIPRATIAGDISAVAAQADRIYLAIQSTCTIFDLCDLDSPQQLGSIQLADEIETIALVDDRSIIAVSYDEIQEQASIVRIDVCDPNKPIIDGSLSLTLNPAKIKVANQRSAQAL